MIILATAEPLPGCHSLPQHLPGTNPHSSHKGRMINAGISQDKTMHRYIGRDEKQARETMNKAFLGMETGKRGPEREDFIL